MSNDKQLLTHSRATSFKRCRKLHWFQYEIMLRPVEAALALRIGSEMHRLCDLLRTTGLGVARAHIAASVGDWRDPYMPNTLLALIEGYAARWAHCSLICETIASEQAFRLSLQNPDGGTSRTFDLAGKIDSISRLHDGRVVNVETKTTSADLSVESGFWPLLLMDPQISLYFIAAKQAGYDVETIVYDVIKKPTIRPRKATPEDKRKYKKDGTLYANQREQDETEQEWYERLTADIAERPDFYFARKEVPRLQQDLDHFAYEIWDIGKDIRQAQLTGRWYRNVGKWTCGNCAYFSLCAGLAPWESGDIAPEGFEYLDDPHPELK